MKYVAIDTETTGLGQRCAIVELAMVVEDTGMNDLIDYEQEARRASRARGRARRGAPAAQAIRAMIEFRLASSGSEVYEAQIHDVKLYLFKLHDTDGWRLTANLLGLVGYSLATSELRAAQRMALGVVAGAASARAEILTATAAQCREELRKREETDT